MRRRLFLMALVAALMLILAALRAAYMATPFSGGNSLGGVSFWELRHSLPQGVFTAAILLLCGAAFSLCMQAALKLARGKMRNIDTFLRVASACLWCGVPTLASCTLCMHLIFPPETTCAPSELPFEILGVVSFLLILCLLTARFRHQAFAWLCLPVSLLSLMICGELQGQTITILPGSVFLSTGLALCLTWRHISVALCACIVGICSHALLTCPDLACGTAYAATLLCLALPLGIKLMTERN